MEESKSKIVRSNKKDKLELIEAIVSNADKPTFESDISLFPVRISDESLDRIDNQTIAPKYYNSFNFAKLSKRNSNINVVLGVTSANKGEGKTLVASNMAVSLAKAYQQRTVLVDLNFENPQLHKIFGAPLGPGLVEAMEDRMLRINPTTIENLFLLSAGECDSYKPGIKDTLALREILFTLKYEFDFVIVDMSAIFPFDDFPVHFINEVDGLITVVDTQHTRREHLKEIYKHIDEKRFVGYIFNKVNEKR